jgi:sulfotransferase family protein
MSVNIAMWSGPRNISTAMMYSFGSRPDCEVWDEPFYAFSLAERGNDHPLRQEIISRYETRYETIVARCVASPPHDKPLFYQKHMTHHMLPGFDRRWILGIANAFLIRDPRRVLASYARKWEKVSLRDIGILEQWELFQLVADDKGSAPIVIDADDVLANPRLALGRLCRALDIDFSETMLSWPPGPKPFDGVWGRHWYNAVHASTGFDRPSSAAAENLPVDLERIAAEAAPVYQKLHAHRLAASAAADVQA